MNGTDRSFQADNPRNIQAGIDLAIHLGLLTPAEIEAFLREHSLEDIETSPESNAKEIGRKIFKAKMLEAFKIPKTITIKINTSGIEISIEFILQKRNTEIFITEIKGTMPGAWLGDENPVAQRFHYASATGMVISDENAQMFLHLDSNTLSEFPQLIWDILKSAGETVRTMGQKPAQTPSSAQAGTRGQISEIISPPRLITIESKAKADPGLQQERARGVTEERAQIVQELEEILRIPPGLFGKDKALRSRIEALIRKLKSKK